MDGVIIINYTGRKGGGALDALETAKALLECGQRVIPIISNQIENIKMWRELHFEKLITIDTYHSLATYVYNTLLFPFKQKKKIAKELDDYCVKAVYCPMTANWTVAINKIFSDSKIIIVNHDPIAHSGTNRVLNLLSEKTFKSADIVIVHTKKFIDYTSDKYGRTEYLPLGRHNMYRKVEKKMKIISYDDRKINFLFFGRIAKYKGLDVLAQAYSKIDNEYMGKTTLTIIGNGDFSEYSEQYKEINVTVINRWITDEEVESIFTGTNIVCVCPYKDATQSGVIFVAYDYGVPVIASDTGGIEEQVIDSKTGILIPPNDVDSLYEAMKMFINHDVNIDEMKIHIKQFLDRFSWNDTAKRLIEMIDEEKK